MQSNKIFSLFCLLALSATMVAQDTPAVKKPEPTKIRAYEDVITAKAISRPGLFTVHKVDEKYYFEIPDSLLNRELISTSRLVKVPSGSFMYGGEVVNVKTLAFERGNNKNIFLRVVTLVSVADSSQAIAKAVRNANEDPIAMVFDIKAYGKDKKSTVIEVTDLFLKDNIVSGFDPAAKTKMKLGGVMADRSFVLSMNSYPYNIETKTVKSFTAGGPGGPAGQVAGPAPEGAAATGAGLTLEMSNSIMLMPKVPMQARYFDKRVGYFADDYKVFSDDQQKVEENVFIVRFKLEPKDEDKARYKRGELVEPKEQIIYYTDPATPKQWRPYIIAGINDWNVAFEKAGFKNAIVGKEWPENDTTMSLEDARYKIVRYLPSEIPNAYGPNIHDPRSGEILQSYVGWYHNIMRTLHDWYFLQAAAVDPAARKMKFDNELMGKLIRFAVSHEIGHTLGLRHNMGSSSQTPVGKLRDKKWLAANGHTVSIMDYARFNYVAQPEDGISQDALMPKIGEYDKWAIQWGYRWTDENSEADKKIAAKLILDSLKANARLWFGGEGKNFDPRCQTEDLSDNSVKASEYGMKNLKIVMANLLEWTKEENDTYENAMQMYDGIGGQYKRYADHVLANIGGIYENIKSVEQTGDVYLPVPKSIQKESIAFLNREVFQTPTWIYDQNVLNKFRKPAREEYPEKQQDIVMGYLLSLDRLQRMTAATMNFGPVAYSLEEMLTDLNKGLWSELSTHQPIDPYRRKLQKKYLATSLTILGRVGKPLSDPAAIDITNTDIPVAIRSQLESIRTKVIAAMPYYKDALTLAHLNYIADKIKRKLNSTDDSTDIASE